MYKIAFIGCGNMGGALVGAVAKTLNGNEIAVYDKDEQKTKTMQEKYGVVVASAEDIAKNARFVVLGVKPQVMESALLPMQSAFKENQDLTLITMAAGLSISAIQTYAGGEYPTIRIMPNTPCMLGEGAVLYTQKGVAGTKIMQFLTMFSGAGKLFEMTEEQIDSAGALSGCGPAFFYLFIDALADGAVSCGIDKEQAIQLATQTMLGSAKMLFAYGDPITLKNNVCSPGGTTLAGVAALEKGEFSKVAASAVTAAYQRTLELKK